MKEEYKARLCMKKEIEGVTVNFHMRDGKFAFLLDDVVGFVGCSRNDVLDIIPIPDSFFGYYAGCRKLFISTNALNITLDKYLDKVPRYLKREINKIIDNVR